MSAHLLNRKLAFVECDGPPAQADVDHNRQNSTRWRFWRAPSTYRQIAGALPHRINFWADTGEGDQMVILNILAPFLLQQPWSVAFDADSYPMASLMETSTKVRVNWRTGPGAESAATWTGHSPVLFNLGLMLPGSGNSIVHCFYVPVGGNSQEIRVRTSADDFTADSFYATARRPIGRLDRAERDGVAVVFYGVDSDGYAFTWRSNDFAAWP